PANAWLRQQLILSLGNGASAALHLPQAGSTMTLAAPSPPWRLPLEPTHCDQQRREHDNVRAITKRCHAGRKHKGSGDHESEVRTKDGPSLPRARKPPTPTVGLGRKPVLTRHDGCLPWPQSCHSKDWGSRVPVSSGG